jgi:hypothetical protein
MNLPSSITFNVGAPTFGGWRLCCRLYGVIRATQFPFWNGTSMKFLMILKTKSLHKPSSNTLNVGAPTFFNLRVTPAYCRQACMPPRWRRYQPAVPQ